MLKKMISCVLILSFFIFPVSAVIPGEDTVAAVISDAEVAVQNYFDQRELYLAGSTNTIPSAFSGIVEDEDMHRSQLEAKDISFVGSQIVILEVFFEGSFGAASVTETAKYKKNGVVITEQVLHEISLHKVSDSIAVGADAYIESVSGFSSCSYVSDSMASASVQASVGGAPCLCVVASNEVGYTETYDNITKYGAFLGMDGLGWCASFIAWCAAQANVPASVLPRVSGTWSLSDHFTLQGNFYYSSSFGGSTAPKVGDIFFLGTGTGGGVTHVGIVVGVTSSSIQVVDGNWGDQVCSRTISRTATDLVGYGRPAYTTSSHTYGNYQYNSTYHWGSCDNCGVASTQEVHTFAPTGQYNELVCTICGYASGMQVNAN